MVIGEALAAIRREDAQLAATIPDLAAAVGLRNVLVHGYEAVDDDVIWLTVSRSIEPLLIYLRQLICE